ncbi:MAG TPA: response regulator [Anaerolineales bacterium]|nr:response regulator [Anaerolineales bacterium]
MEKILFCDDDDINRKLIRIILRDQPYQLLFASDGQEGLEMVERERPALVFTDLHMTGLDGLELCAAIRAREYLAAIPVILMTGTFLGNGLNESTLGRSLFTASLVKPFSTGAIVDLIERCLGRADGPILAVPPAIQQSAQGQP